MLDKLTLITPVRITSRKRFREAKVAMTQFYRCCKPARHLIASANPPRYERKFIKLMEKLGAPCEYLAPGCTALEGFIAMAEAAETEYIFPLLADVKAMAKKDFMSPCIAAMERDPSLVQVRVCGHPFSSAKTNTSLFDFDGQQAYFREDRSIRLNPTKLEDNTIWTLSMAPENQKFFYPIPLWSTVMRTSFLRRCIDAVRSELGKAKTIDDLNGILCGPSDPKTCLPLSTEWPEHLAFIQNLRQGSLNLAAYMYALGRERKKERQFRREQMEEIFTGEQL